MPQGWETLALINHVESSSQWLMTGQVRPWNAKYNHLTQTGRYKSCATLTFEPINHPNDTNDVFQLLIHVMRHIIHEYYVFDTSQTRKVVANMIWVRKDGGERQGQGTQMHLDPVRFGQTAFGLTIYSWKLRRVKMISARYTIQLAKSGRLFLARIAMHPTGCTRSRFMFHWEWTINPKQDM